MCCHLRFALLLTFGGPMRILYFGLSVAQSPTQQSFCSVYSGASYKLIDGMTVVL